MVKIVTCGSLGPLLPFSKSPPELIQIGNFQKKMFCCFLCYIEPTCQKFLFYNQNCDFWPLGPL